MNLELGANSIVLEQVVRAAQGGLRVSLSPAARQRMQAARDVLDDHLARGIPVYGLNTGLGGNIAHRIDIRDAAALQEKLVLARVAAVGDLLPVEACRAILFCRLVGLAQAGAGISLPVFDLLTAMLERDVVPAIPSRGSTGASDLVQTMSLAAAAIGQGPVYFGGRIISAADALRAVQLSPARLAPKDGLSIGSSSAVACATAALALAGVEHLVHVATATAALACQGFGANPHLFDAEGPAARPAGRQVEAAALFRRLLSGSTYFDRHPAKVQDAISFRALPQVFGSVLAALAGARDDVEAELNAVADNPLVLHQTGTVRSTANFLNPDLALAMDTLAIAMAHLATASAQRSIKLMTGRLSGLPNYLSPVGGASAGFVPLQKSIAALHAEIRLKAQPASLDSLVVSDTVEDLGTNVVLGVAKLREQLEPLRWMVAIEALVAAQAVDLRRDLEPDLLLGRGSAAIYNRVRSAVPKLEEDRPTGIDAAEVHRRLWSPDALPELGEMLEQSQ